MLTTDSAEARFDFGARKDLYSAYVPFAVAAGAAALWAKKYETTMGTAAPQPDWYHSSSTTSPGFVGSSSGANFDSFESALSSSIAAYTASQSSSGGGSSGGVRPGGQPWWRVAPAPGSPGGGAAGRRGGRERGGCAASRPPRGALRGPRWAAPR